MSVEVLAVLVWVLYALGVVQAWFAALSVEECRVLRDGTDPAIFAGFSRAVFAGLWPLWTLIYAVGAVPAVSRWLMRRS